MKHLFYVHSHITFLVSKQYVFDQGINPDDCLFFCTRGYRYNDEYSQIFRNGCQYPKDIFANENFDILPRFNFIKGYHNIHLLENFINDKFNNDSFVFYTFNTSSHVHSVIATMKKCLGYYIIEEGLSAYTEINKLPQLYKGVKKIVFKHILQPIFPRFFILKDHIFSSSSKYYLGTIAILPEAFNPLPPKHLLVTNPFSEISLGFAPTVVISIDSAFEIYQVPLDAIATVFQKIKDNIALKENIVVAAKFHPYYYIHTENKEKFQAVLKTVFGELFRELPMDAILEDVLNTYHSDFYSLWSSIGIYAQRNGCKCYSFAHFLNEKIQNKEYQYLLKKIPPMFYDTYQILK